MAHPEQRRFVELVNEHILQQARPKKILEVGSYDVNGTIRGLFKDSTAYVGADIMEGPGVDMIRSGHEIDLESNSFDLSISCECFEHNPYWLETFLNMIRMTRPGGLVVFTCASRGRLEHGTERSERQCSFGNQSVGWQYYRNLQSADFAKRLDLSSHFETYRFYFFRIAADLYFFGVKKGGVPPEFDLHAFESEVAGIRLLERARTQHWSTKEKVLRTAYDMPNLVAALILDDKSYQNFALTYIPARARIIHKIRNMASRLARGRI